MMMTETNTPKKLNVQIQLGGIIFRFKAEENRDKNKPTQPDFRGHNIGVWINEDKSARQEDNDVNRKNISESVQVL